MTVSFTTSEGFTSRLKELWPQPLQVVKERMRFAWILPWKRPRRVHCGGTPVALGDHRGRGLHDIRRLDRGHRDPGRVAHRRAGAAGSGQGTRHLPPPVWCRLQVTAVPGPMTRSAHPEAIREQPPSCGRRMAAWAAAPPVLPGHAARQSRGRHRRSAPIFLHAADQTRAPSVRRGAGLGA